MTSEDSSSYSITKTDAYLTNNSLMDIPESPQPYHTWISNQERTSGTDLKFRHLQTLNYRAPGKKEIHLNFSLPLSSWLDRISITDRNLILFN